MYLTNDAVLATGPTLPTAEEREQPRAFAEAQRILNALAEKYRRELVPAVYRATRSYLVALLDRARAEVIAREFDGLPGFDAFQWLVGTRKMLAELLADAVGGGLIPADDPVVAQVKTFLSTEG